MIPRISFTSLNEQNEHLMHWESSVADTRIHGTTRRQVGRVFREQEKDALLPLPAERFPCFQEAQRTVHRDGHVAVERACYSVPLEYLGRQVWVRWDGRLVRIFNNRMEQIALHAKVERGRFSTQNRHLLDEKISGVEKSAAWWLSQVGRVGPHTRDWSVAMLKSRGIAGIRVLMGLKQLAEKHARDVVERACETAHASGGYAVIKSGFTVLYRSIFDVVRDFLHEAAFDGDDKTLQRYLKPDLLIIDDMGGMKQLPKRSGECLFEIILRRHEVKSTMMTSNRPLEDWGKLIGDVPAASAILDRFLERSELIQITGRSYRLRNRTANADKRVKNDTKDVAEKPSKTDISDRRVEVQKTSEKPASKKKSKPKGLLAPRSGATGRRHFLVLAVRIPCPIPCHCFGQSS